ncbi:phosphoribosylaminoimidazolesuccinocarboxamide synthase [Pseudenhygromyxa sp. WMMC2535]|uniref:phosphoribosylaminoimidazolesuccinocarboxamide synthase n=1 Tax=Pseudenhygromyxa sp. WMMC2535 TaxID=2712867 RepID=UPI001553A701|nr:phosphoribosylaminoimidazolesuccinocarboxamide synthase [Pseudenhygromyxa sp. WMMC2535]NVB41578.1 phosphoribosylaminoimidazolesuccinocarboxamide synthase [Pseudenhygromyxa sp. WMMC2535]
MPVTRELLQHVIDEGLVLDALPEDFDRLGERYSGKVRENFSTHGGERIIVVSDRVSAFDCVLGTIPFKGQVLNALAAHWFEATAALFPNHLIEVADPAAIRAVECRPIPIEMVVRGYLTGSSSTSIWRAYERGYREFCGHELPGRMRRHEKLRFNIVTPTTKARKGEHDLNTSKQALVRTKVIELELYNELERRCLALFAEGQRLAAERGLILADTKYELGRRPDGEIVLIDEIHTPDSSRYWYAESYERAMSRGESPRALDKEYVRTWLIEQGFDGEGVPPSLPDEVRIEAAMRYVEAYERVTGKTFEPDLRPPLPRLREALKLG